MKVVIPQSLLAETERGFSRSVSHTVFEGAFTPVAVLILSHDDDLRSTSGVGNPAFMPFLRSAKCMQMSYHRSRAHF